MDVARSRGMIYEWNDFYSIDMSCSSDDDCCQNGVVPGKCHGTENICSKRKICIKKFEYGGIILCVRLIIGKLNVKHGLSLPFSVEQCADKIEIQIESPQWDSSYRNVSYCVDGLTEHVLNVCQQVTWAYGTYQLEYEGGAEKLVNGFVTYTMDFSEDYQG